MSIEMIENYAWVDECLRQMYYSYAFTVENYDEYEDAGLLKENWAWVDEQLEEMCIPEDRIPVLAPDEWAFCLYDQLVCIEEFREDFMPMPMHMPKKRTRSESDISNYEDCISAVIKRINHCIYDTMNESAIEVEMKEV